MPFDWGLISLGDGIGGVAKPLMSSVLMRTRRCRRVGGAVRRRGQRRRPGVLLFGPPNNPVMESTRANRINCHTPVKATNVATSRASCGQA